MCLNENYSTATVGFTRRAQLHGFNLRNYKKLKYVGKFNLANYFSL
jgi:hypothetical protein